MSDGLPNRELLESTHTFPCRYTFKAIGTADDHFVGRVLAAVKVHLQELAEPSFSCRATATGRHISVTVEPEVDGAGHIIDIYRELQGVDGLVMLL
ncbi:YbeD family protein [Planctomicrobium sp. SH664]|uniref:YbeD family protein n=1 Tax=Planctomicrobium sp. SH664 TaxID=3448125 RepID=UPI003F5BB650